MRDTLRTGRRNELKVIDKLLELGYQVFECVLPSAVDVLIKCGHDKFMKLQVKTCSTTPASPTFPIQVAHFGSGKPYAKSEVDFFIGVHGSSFYVVPFRKAHAGGVRSRYSAKRADLNRWDLLPPAA